jgi:CRP-like cAMP-binding protein
MITAESRVQNKLLNALSSDTRERIFPHLRLTSMALGTVVYESGQNEDHVYFPNDCIISMLYLMIDGASAEISVIGNEGIVGIAAFMGGLSTTSRAVSQSAGYAFRLPATVLMKEFNTNAKMRMLILRYTQTLITQMTQTAACNRHHSIQQQLCRWILLSMDRLTGNRLNMTQELIANMLGVRREGVTEAAGKLQKLGAIDYKRGQITVLDRALLEKISCECYRMVRKETDRLQAFMKSTQEVEPLRIRSKELPILA